MVEKNERLYFLDLFRILIISMVLIFHLRGHFFISFGCVTVDQFFGNGAYGMTMFFMLSGGTNSKSAELAKLCGIQPDGIAIGSYARQIVKEYLDRDDFLENPQAFEAALSIAKQLVSTILSDLK